MNASKYLVVCILQKDCKASQRLRLLQDVWHTQYL